VNSFVASVAGISGVSRSSLGTSFCGALAVLDNIVLLRLLPYRPELNPMESVRDYLRQNKLCALVWNSYDEIVEACKTVWNWLIADPKRIFSIGRRDRACVSLWTSWDNAINSLMSNYN
jgi:hypothetical protein